MKHFTQIFLVCLAFLGLGFFLNLQLAQAATNISSAPGERWAWNDIIGWVDFYGSNTVNVLPAKMSGYATTSSAGEISLDCATTSAGNICGTSNYNVVNDGSGNLSGWGWNDTYGWVSFCGGAGTAACPGAINYQVLITNGDFSGFAWNDVLGWMSFNCTDPDPDICGTSNYKVATTWTATSTLATLDSSIYDTGITQGAQLNNVIWRGVQPSGTFARFQFAASNATSGPWSYLGPDGTGNTYYTVNVNEPYALDYSHFNNRRYFRYRITLVSNLAQTISPRVDDVIVSWSP